MFFFSPPLLFVCRRLFEGLDYAASYECLVDWLDAELPECCVIAVDGADYCIEAKSHNTLLFTAQEPLIATIRGNMQILLRKNRPSLLNHVLTEYAVNAHSCSVNSNHNTYSTISLLQ